mmetsp:Transcript_1500/g.3042  ORF Transcript_1500/g.3042 Transcript_1500/m.3042 type:complete len:270 (-) Transcript_1500:310-1119(-)
MGAQRLHVPLARLHRPVRLLSRVRSNRLCRQWRGSLDGGHRSFGGGVPVRAPKVVCGGDHSDAGVRSHLPDARHAHLVVWVVRFQRRLDLGHRGVRAGCGQNHGHHHGLGGLRGANHFGARVQLGLGVRREDGAQARVRKQRRARWLGLHHRWVRGGGALGRCLDGHYWRVRVHGGQPLAEKVRRGRRCGCGAGARVLRRVGSRRGGALRHKVQLQGRVRHLRRRRRRVRERSARAALSPTRSQLRVCRAGYCVDGRAHERRVWDFEVL